jgi:hypothetical protein
MVDNLVLGNDPLHYNKTSITYYYLCHSLLPNIFNQAYPYIFIKLFDELIGVKAY